MPSSEQIKAQSLSAYGQWKELWREHASIHSKFKMKSFNDFFNIGIGRSCLLVANGYSLQEQIETIKENLNILVNYFYQEISHKITWISNYTFDFAIIDSKPYLIELNSFGKEYAAGSALYHWELDEKILYNDFSDGNLTIEFRYTI
jgi:hypothetical protein